MSASLFSSHWYRISQLKPRLREAVTVRRQHWRNQLWYLLTDETTGQQTRINTSAYQLIGRCDGKLTVQQVWDSLLLELEDNAPTQDEVLDLLAKLNQLELIQNEQETDIDSLFERRDQRKKQKVTSYLNPFMIKLPVGNPNTWLKKLDKLASFLFTPAIFFAWFLLIALAIFIAGSEWEAIISTANQYMFSSRYLVLSALCFPVIKTLHELGHGLAIRRWGGDVYEFGISFLVFVPAPYVDATAANAFTLKSQRMVVSAAGIMIETGIAALALFVWLNVQSGLIRDIAFVTMIIGTISTIIFNGNPLLRFDGYYVLSDFLDIPNLANRSQQFWQEMLSSFIVGHKKNAFDTARGEKKWLVIYAPLSFCYRIMIAIIITSWLGEKSFLLGLLTALYMAYTMLLRPIMHWTKQLIMAGESSQENSRIRLNLSILGIGFVVALFIVPLPYTTVAPAVTWLPEKAQIRPEENGFIKSLPIKNGQKVKTGDLIAMIDNPQLNKRKEKLLGVLEGLRADQFQLLINNPSESQNITEKILNAENELLHVNQQIKNLNIYAKMDGKLVMPKQEDILGSYVKRGQNMGFVFEKTQIKIKAAIPEKDAYFVRNMSKNIHIWLAEDPHTEYDVKMIMDTPSATNILPSEALSANAGGYYVTDNQDPKGTKLLEPVFLFDLTLLGSTMERVGGTAFVRFDHQATPLASQLYHRANQLFLGKFEPSS